MTKESQKVTDSLNTSVVSLLQYCFAIMVIVIHSGRLFQYEPLHFFLKSFLGRMAVPYFLICTAFFLKGRLREANREKQYFKQILKTYLLWSLIYLPYAYAFFESLRLPKHYLPLGLCLALSYFGMCYHLWYIPALLLGWVLVQLSLKTFGQKVTLIIVAGLYLLGSMETYSHFLSSTPFEPLLTGYMHIFQTSRNGIFYTPAYLCAGCLLYDHFSSSLFSQRYMRKAAVCLILLALESLLIYHHQGLDKNFFLLSALFTTFLFNASVRISLLSKYSLAKLKKLSYYYFFLHPMFIECSLFLLRPYQLAPATKGKLVFLMTLLATHLCSEALMLLVRSQAHAKAYLKRQ